MQNVFSFVRSDENEARLLSADLLKSCSCILIWEGRLLWGRRILEALAEKKELTPVVKTIEATAMEALVEVVSKESRPSGWSWTELVEIADFALAHQSEPGLVMSALGISESENHKLKQYSSLPVYLRTLVSQEKLDLKTAVKSAGLDETLLRLGFENPAYSFAERRLMLGWMNECEIPKAIPEDWRSRKVFFEWLKQKKYPLLASLEDRFEKINARYCQGRNIQLKAPENFEGNTFEAVVKFSSKKQLEKSLKGLEDLAEHYDELLELLQ
jgi:hypothetical protein